MVLLWYCYCTSMVLLCDSHIIIFTGRSYSIPTVLYSHGAPQKMPYSSLQRHSHDIPIVFPQYSHCIPLVLPQHFQPIPTVFPEYSQSTQSVATVFPMVFSCHSHSIPIVLLMYYCAIPITFPKIPIVCPKAYPDCSHAVSTGLPEYWQHVPRLFP